jgi:mono/diheme cytochrome c family protein
METRRYRPATRQNQRFGWIFAMSGVPAFGSACSDTEIAAVANYVTARFGSKGSPLTAQDVAELRQQASQ